jgi:hypothetical protein
MRVVQSSKCGPWCQVVVETSCCNDRFLFCSPVGGALVQGHVMLAECAVIDEQEWFLYLANCLPKAWWLPDIFLAACVYNFV